VRKTPAAIDIDIVAKIITTKGHDTPTMVYDGPTHLRYGTPSKNWEHWYCHTAPGKDLDSCKLFLPNWMNFTYHHSNTEVRRDHVKGRGLFAAENIPAGHFVLPEDAAFALRMDTYQWDALNEFLKTFPDATMYKQLQDFFYAYGFESETMGNTGWAVSGSCNNTFTNHGCTKEEQNLSPVNYVFDDEDKTGDVAFSPVLFRRPAVISVLAMARVDISAGDELMIDYSTFRSEGNTEFTSFLSSICESGEGLVPIEDEDIDDEEDSGDEL
jgi:hypothetical protein